MSSLPSSGSLSSAQGFSSVTWSLVSGYRLGADREARVRAGIQQPLPGWLTLLLPDNEPVRRKVFLYVLLLSDKSLPEVKLDHSSSCLPQTFSSFKCWVFRSSDLSCGSHWLASYAIDFTHLSLWDTIVGSS